MLTLDEIIKLVDEHEARTGETMTELSRRATNKTDTIRNWRRKLENGEEGSASFHNVQAILNAIGVNLEWRAVNASEAQEEPEPRLNGGEGKLLRGSKVPDVVIRLAELFPILLRAHPDLQVQIARYLEGRLSSGQEKSRATETKHVS